MKQIDSALKSRLKLTAAYLLAPFVILSQLAFADEHRWLIIVPGIAMFALGIGGSVFIWWKYWADRRDARSDGSEHWPEQGL